MPKKWEYKVVHLKYEDETSSQNEKLLNTLGQEGWELIAVAIDGTAGYNDAYLKREAS